MLEEASVLPPRKKMEQFSPAEMLGDVENDQNKAQNLPQSF